MMLPPAWEKNPDLDPDVRAFYEYNNTLIEPWDGPADIVFTDGTQVGALLDRNGFRPGRWQLTDDGYIVLAPRPAFCRRLRRNTSCPRAVLSPARCSWSTPPKAHHSR